MKPPSHETIETKDLSQRELILRVYHLQAEMNGSVKRLNGDVYGDPVHQIIGIKPCVQQHEKWIDRVRTILYAIGLIVASLGIVEVVRLIQWLAG